MQLMLLHALAAQLMVTVGTFLLPMLVILGAPLLTERTTSTLALYSLLILLHTPADGLMLLFFIRPFRRFLMDRVTRCSRTRCTQTSATSPRTVHWSALGSQHTLDAECDRRVRPHSHPHSRRSLVFVTG